ncbi:DNA repair protein RecO [Candidatus Nanosynbacter featherlites]|uniref:DNA repair protein RecO n=1 Tax=Candidatus Nanosynbacter featherlites TaxID=2572088 RepID=A0A4P9A2Q8_9BACT|nr:DNA repair protein RecO [Candidatus Nanosynbacter featherlites]QCT42073.1 DNA repair protein RecO [Candidatus Nanosynbacter featherlites]
MSQSERLQAIVLRRTDYGEADRILHLLTSAGRRNVIAKGVRREKSKLAGGIELFALCDVVVRRGRGELGILTSAQLQQFYRHILDSYERMQFGYEMLKLVNRASEQVDEPAWFSVAQQVLAQLNHVNVEQKLIETWFYLQYAGLLGDELNLRTDVAAHALSPDKTYMYDSTEKGLRPAEQGDLSADALKLLRLIQAKPLANVAQIGGITEVLSACWLVARQHAAV